VSDLTLTFFEALQAAGVPQDKAKQTVEALNQALNSSSKELATKTDLAKIEIKIEAVKNEMLKWYVGIALAQIFAVIYLVGRLTG